MPVISALALIAAALLGVILVRPLAAPGMWYWRVGFATFALAGAAALLVFAGAEAAGEFYIHLTLIAATVGLLCFLLAALSLDKPVKERWVVTSIGMVAGLYVPVMLLGGPHLILFMQAPILIGLFAVAMMRFRAHPISGGLLGGGTLLHLLASQSGGGIGSLTPQDVFQLTVAAALLLYAVAAHRAAGETPVVAASAASRRRSR